jgi:hypothetical protein
MIALPIARQEYGYYIRAQQTLTEIVEAMVRALEGVDPAARAHGERVSKLATEAGRSLRMSEREILALRLASRLHDVGLDRKVQLPRSTMRRLGVAFSGDSLIPSSRNMFAHTTSGGMGRVFQMANEEQRYPLGPEFSRRWRSMIAPSRDFHLLDHLYHRKLPQATLSASLELSWTLRS